MKKIRLEIETLEIVSFETAPAMADDEGTVLAYATKPNQNTCANTCAFQNTCVQDCYWTLWETCGCPPDPELSRFCETAFC